jgi:hypothetical protein
MSTLSIHPIEYLRHHVHFEGVWTRVLTSLGSLVKKVFESSEQSAAITVLLLTVGLVIFSSMTIVQSALFAASYNSAINEVVFPPLQVSQTGMYSFSTLLL